MDFNDIYRNYQGYLASFIARYARNEQDAQDIMQDTWMRFIGRTVSDETTLCGFLRRIAYTAIVDYYRRARMQTTPIDGLKIPVPKSPMDADEKEHLATAFDLAVRDLPEHYRIPMRRHFFDGAAFKSLSNEFGLTVEAYRGMAKETTKRARAAYYAL